MFHFLGSFLICIDLQCVISVLHSSWGIAPIYIISQSLLLPFPLCPILPDLPSDSDASSAPWDASNDLYFQGTFSSTVNKINSPITGDFRLNEKSIWEELHHAVKREYDLKGEPRKRHLISSELAHSRLGVKAVALIFVEPSSVLNLHFLIAHS